MIISAISINSISILPSLSEINTLDKKFPEISSEKNNLNTDYFKQIPLNDYIVGSGDTLRISISREYPELLTEAIVDGEGTIYLPKLNKIYVQGLTVNELKNVLNEALYKFVKFPEVEIRILSYLPRFYLYHES